MNLIKVSFKKSPTGRFGLAYSAGQAGRVRPELIEALLKEGFIEPVHKPEKPEVEAQAGDEETKAESQPTRKRGRKPRA